MIRWMTGADRKAVVALMDATLPKPQRFSYVDLDGHCLVDEVNGQIRGMAQISLARPCTWIHELCIAPAYRKGLVLANLSAAILAAAKAHGSQAVEGFKLAEDPGWINLSLEHGALVHDGARVIWMLDHPVIEQLLKRRQR